MNLLEEARNYSFYTVAAINKQRSSGSEFQAELNQMINKIKNDRSYDDVTFEELIDLTVEFTNQQVSAEGDSFRDKNSVAWFMGKFCYVWRNSLPILNGKFDEIFNASWIRYFSTY